jgi:NTE family protein
MLKNRDRGHLRQAWPSAAKSTIRRRVLVLLGGGALGAYQAGVYEALAAEGLEPEWVTGISIGAINAALIAGNPRERRVERLRGFWELNTSSIGDDTLLAPPEGAA